MNIFNGWKMLIKRNEVAQRKRTLKLKSAFDCLQNYQLKWALHTFVQNINCQVNVYKLANAMETVLRNKMREIFEFKLKPNVFHKLIRPLREIRGLFEGLYTEFNRQFTKYSYKQLYLREIQLAGKIEQRFSDVHLIAMNVPSALTRVAKGAYFAEEIRFR